MQKSIGGLWIRTHMTTTFWWNILCILKHITRKLQVVYENSTCQTTTLLSEVSIFCVTAWHEIRAWYKMWLVRYDLVSNGSKRACTLCTLQSVLDKLLVHTQHSKLKTTGHIWTFCITNDYSTIWEFLVWYRLTWKIGQEGYSPRNSLVFTWYSIVCVYCKPVHTSLFGAQVHMTTKLMYHMSTYYTSKDGFAADAASLCKYKAG